MVKHGDLLVDNLIHHCMDSAQTGVTSFGCQF